MRIWSASRKSGAILVYYDERKAVFAYRLSNAVVCEAIDFSSEDFIKVSY